MRSADVIIVGAGPAGSAAALLLARRGRDVLLVDQARFPRDKPCGEYLNPAAVAALRRLDLVETLQAAGARAVVGAYLTSPGGREVRVPYPAPAGGPPPQGLSVPRLALDAALLRAAQAAGARVREGFRVDDLLRSGPRVVGIVGRGERDSERSDLPSLRGVPGGKLSDRRGEEFRARLVLAADGSRSRMARRLRLAREPEAPRRFGLVAHYEGVEGDDWVEMHAGQRGYCGLGYSERGGANLAMVAEPADLPLLQGRVEEFFAERLAQFPAVARRLAGGRRTGPVLVTGSMSSRAAAAGVPGMLLVGDAAGFYDPFTGEGTSYALRGAELAAEAADVILNHRGTEDTEELEEASRWQPHFVSSLCPLCLCGSDCSVCIEAGALRVYAARRRAEFAPRLMVSRIIQAALSRPWVLEAVFRRFEAEPMLAQRLIGVTAGVLPPSAVLAPAYLAYLFGVPVFKSSGDQNSLSRRPERLNA